MKPARVFDERSEEFARAPRPAAANSEAGRARGAGGRGTYRPARGPREIDENSEPALPCSRAPVLPSVRPHRGTKAEAPARRGGFLVPGRVESAPGFGAYFPFFTFLAALAFATGFAFFAGAFFPFFAAGFTGRVPGVAICDGLPRAATSPK